MERRTPQLWRRDPRPGALALLAGLAGIVFGTLLVAVIVSPAFVALDERLSESFAQVQSPVLDAVFGVFTWGGSFAVLVPLTVLAVVVLLLRGQRPEAVLFAATMAIGPLIGWVFKNLVERSRPGLEFARIPLPSTYAFPSGHALASFLFFGLVAFLVAIEARSLAVRVWTFALCSICAVLVSLSRVYLGVHWFGDVTASWALGVALLSVAVALYIIATANDGDAMVAGRRS